MAGEQRAPEVELQRVQDRHGGDRAGQPHPLGLPDREPGGQPGREAGEGQAARVDRDGARLGEQLARLRLEVEALEALGQQEDEERVVHGRRTL